MLLLIQTSHYDFGTSYEEKKILITLPDGGKAMIKHKTLYLEAKYKKTGEVIEFRLTGKGNVYEDEN